MDDVSPVVPIDMEEAKQQRVSNISDKSPMRVLTKSFKSEIEADIECKSTEFMSPFFGIKSISRIFLDAFNHKFVVSDKVITLYTNVYLGIGFQGCYLVSESQSSVPGEVNSDEDNNTISQRVRSIDILNNNAPIRKAKMQELNSDVSDEESDDIKGESQALVSPYLQFSGI